MKKKILRNNLLKSKQIILEFQAEPKKFKKYHKIKYKISQTSVSTSLVSSGLSLVFKKRPSLSSGRTLVILKIIKPALKETQGSKAFLPVTKIDTILTKKPKDIRMGRGKGVPSEKRFIDEAGSLACTFFGLSGKKALNLADSCKPKLALKTIVNYKW